MAKKIRKIKKSQLNEAIKEVINEATRKTKVIDKKRIRDIDTIINMFKQLKKDIESGTPNPPGIPLYVHQLVANVTMLKRRILRDLGLKGDTY